MTSGISIRPGLLTDHGWQFLATFSGRTHRVTVTQAYWNKLTHGEISPKELLLLGLEEARLRRVAETLPEAFDFALLASRVENFERRMKAEAKATAAGVQR